MRELAGNDRLALIGFDLVTDRSLLERESEQRIEMHLIGSVNHTVPIGAAAIRMLRGDFIRTEYCHKYTTGGFASLAAQAGWTLPEGLER